MEKKNHRLKKTVRKEKGEPLETLHRLDDHLYLCHLGENLIWKIILYRAQTFGPRLVVALVHSTASLVAVRILLGERASYGENRTCKASKKNFGWEHHRCAAEFTQFAQAALLNGVDLAATGHI